MLRVIVDHISPYFILSPTATWKDSNLVTKNVALPSSTHLNTYQQQRLKIKTQCFLSLNHEKKILLIK